MLWCCSGASNISWQNREGIPSRHVSLLKPSIKVSREVPIDCEWFVTEQFYVEGDWLGWKVFETIAEPRSYSTYAKFSRTGTSKVELLTSVKATLESAVARFEAFFKEKTGKEWKDMGNYTVQPPKLGTEGESLPPHEGWFYVEKESSILAEFIRATPKDDSETAID